MEFRYIDRNGIALDDYGHEFRNENGEIILVPIEERGFYDIAYRPNESIEENEIMTDENTIMNNVYDYLFQNDKFIDLDFCEVFPSSGIDNESNVIYLAKNDQQSLYKITIERI